MRRTIFVGVAGCLAAVIGASSAWAGTYEWAIPDWKATWSAPRLADDRGFAIEATTDAIYVAGVTGSHDVGAGDLFLLKYDLAGNLLWNRTWGEFELDQAQALHVDLAGNIWVAGSGTTDDAAAEIFAVLLRYDADGTGGLVETFDRQTVDFLQAVATDDQGVVYVGGFTHASRLDRDLWVERLDLDGDATDDSWTWVHDGGANEWDEAWDLVVSGGEVYVAGYETKTGETTTEAALWVLDAETGVVDRSTFWRDDSPEGGNGEARALTLEGSDVLVTGGIQKGRSTDIFVAKFAAADLSRAWLHTTEGTVSGGGGYGISVGDRGIYVAAGNYDFPAGGDTAILRFGHDGALEWSQILGYPAFWDWGFDVSARDGKFYVTGVLWKAGAEWYEILTLAYDEDFPTASLEGVAAKTVTGDLRGARADMDHFYVGDFLRWAESEGATWQPEGFTPDPGSNPDPGDPPAVPALPAFDPSGIGEPDPSGSSYVRWEGASGYGKNYGVIWLDPNEDPAVGEDGGVDAILGLQDDLSNGNYALVRNYTGIRVSLFGGFVRLRYFISHDRLIPQGGLLYVGDVGIAIPPPPV